MPAARSHAIVLEQEFLPLRAKILEIAAGLDRLDRAEGDAGSDVRRERLEEAMRILLSSEAGRAERVQLLFSREFDEKWRSAFGV